MRKNKNGFTLVEMVVVLVIIAILATLGITALNGYIDKANEKKVMANLRQLVIATESEFAEQKDSDLAALSANSDIAISSSTIGTKINDISGIPDGDFYRVTYSRATKRIVNVLYVSGDYIGIYLGDGMETAFGTASSLVITNFENRGIYMNNFCIFKKDNCPLNSTFPAFIIPTQKSIYIYTV